MIKNDHPKSFINLVFMKSLRNITLRDGNKRNKALTSLFLIKFTSFLPNIILHEDNKRKKVVEFLQKSLFFCRVIYFSVLFSIYAKVYFRQQ
jgi:hypothetical protein